MINPRIKTLLEAGVHFGHQTRRWNPKMKPFIFTARNGIYIIDLMKTLVAIDEAKRKIAEVVSRGRSILFVGTKKQAADVVKSEAQRSGQYFVTTRWLGGMLTNFDTIKLSIRKLKEFEQMREDGTLEKFTKKERSLKEREYIKLDRVLGGIKDMNHLPGLAFVVDAKKECIAVAEARRLGIPIIAILDTNADPDPIDFPIAANDDAIKSIKVITREITDSILEARNKTSAEEMAAAAEADAQSNGDRARSEAYIAEGSDPR
ncbi:MAG: 30S ribosomal protein S2 [Candidatus Zixiibacteriota bacterium]